MIKNNGPFGCMQVVFLFESSVPPPVSVDTIACTNGFIGSGNEGFEHASHGARSYDHEDLTFLNLQTELLQSPGAFL